jgi:hypothetical protein
MHGSSTESKIYQLIIFWLRSFGCDLLVKYLIYFK